MAFDPNKYLAEKTGKSGFNPDAYLQAKLGSAPTEAPSELESAARGAVQGATFGFAPALVGAAEAVPTALDAVSGQGSLKDILDAYNKARSESNTKFKAAQEANPKSFFAGNLAGGLAPALLTGGVGEGAALAKGIAGTLPVSAKTAAAALTGAGYGALSGAGEAASSGEDLGDAAKSVLGNAAGGALLGSAASKLGDALGNLPQKLDEFGNEQAVRATGMSKGMMKKLIQQDVKNQKYAAASGTKAPESSVQKLGKLVSEPNELTKKPIVGAFSTPEDILENAQEVNPLAGKAMGDIRTQLDQIYNSSKPEGMENFFNPSKASDEVEKQLAPTIKQERTIPAEGPAEATGETPSAISVRNVIPRAEAPLQQAVENVKEIIDSYGDQPITFDRSAELLSRLKRLASFEPNGTGTQQIYNRAYGIVNKAVDDASEKVAAASGNSELADKYQKMKDLYGASQKAIDASTTKVAGEMANRTVSPSDYLAGAAGAVAHGGSGAIVAGLGNKILRTYGTSMAAQTAKHTSQILSNVNKALVDAPKETIANFGQQLISTGGELEKSLGNVLTKMAGRDDIGRNALVFSLMQNAGYRDLLKKYMGIDESNKQ